jgi:hypothetical protein
MKSKRKNRTKSQICSDTTKGHVYFKHEEWLRIHFGEQAANDYIDKMNALKRNKDD